MTTPARHRFVLIRHAEAACNVLAPDALISGYDSGSPLTPRGRAQAAALAAALPDALLGEAVFTSPLRRAEETAAFLAAARGLPLRSDARLAEMAVNTPFDPPMSLAAWDAMLEARVQSESGVVLPMGVEPLAEQDRRVRAFLDERHARRGGSPVTLVVAHAFTIELALLALLGLPMGVLDAFRFRLSNTGVHVVENDRIGSPARLVLTNCCVHLGNWA